MHSLSPLLVLYASIVFVQMEAPSAALSDDSSEVNVEHVSFTTEDNGVIYADLYGEGDRGVVLAHGGRFTKQSWQPQAQILGKSRLSGPSF
jgi:hypothetical protein